MKLATLKNFDYLSLIKDLRVEPIMLTIFMSGGLGSIVNSIGTYRIICQHVLGTENDYFNCMNPAESANSKYGNYSDSFLNRLHSEENRVQRANVFWHMMFRIAYTIPAFFGDTILAALGDRYGRKVNILVGIAGMLMASFPHLILFTFHRTPLYLLVVIGIFASFTGYQSIIHISFYAYLADTVADPRNLTVRMSVLTSMAFASGLITPILSAMMMTRLTYAQVALVTHCIGVFAFFLALFLLRQVPPKVMRKMVLEKYIKKHGHAPPGIEEEDVVKLTNDKDSSDKGLGYKEPTCKEESISNGSTDKGPSDEMSTDKNLSDMESTDKNPTAKDHWNVSSKSDIGGARITIAEGNPASARNNETSFIRQCSYHSSASAQRSDRTKKCSLIREIVSILKEFLLLIKEIYVTWKKPRPGKARTYLLVITLVYFLHMAFESGGRTSIISLYVQKSPFLWGPKELGFYMSFWCGTQFVGSLVGIALLKKCLKLRDTTIVILVMATHIVETVMIAFAKTAAELYVSAAVGCLWSALVPCVKSFMTQLVDPDEVGKSYILFGLATTISMLFSGLGYGGIYMATLAYFPGFVFLLAGCLELICIGGMIWMHIDYKKNHKKR